MSWDSGLTDTEAGLRFKKSGQLPDAEGVPVNRLLVSSGVNTFTFKTWDQFVSSIGAVSIATTWNFTGQLQRNGNLVLTSVNAGDINAANSPATGQVLSYNGSGLQWVTPSGGSGGPGFDPSLSYTITGNWNFTGSLTKDGNTVWHSGNLSNSQINNFTTAYGWGNHASAGYLLPTNLKANGGTILETGEVIAADLDISNTAFAEALLGFNGTGFQWYSNEIGTADSAATWAVTNLDAEAPNSPNNDFYLEAINGGEQLLISGASDSPGEPNFHVLNTTDFSRIAGTPDITGAPDLMRVQPNSSPELVAFRLFGASPTFMEVRDSSDWSVVAGTAGLVDFSVRDMAFNPAGTQLAVTTIDGTESLLVFDTSTWTEIATGISFTGGGHGVEYSADGSLLFVGTASGLKAYQTASWTEVVGTPTVNSPRSISAHPNENIVAIGLTEFGNPTSNVRVYNTDTWVELATFGFSGDIYTDKLKFDINGAFILVCTEAAPYLQVIRVSDWSIMDFTASLPGEGSSIALNPLGTSAYIAHAGGDHLMEVYKVDPTSLRDTDRTSYGGDILEAEFAPTIRANPWTFINEDVEAFIDFKTFYAGSGLHPTLRSYRARGTEGSPAGLSIDDSLFQLIAFGYDGGTLAYDLVGTFEARKHTFFGTDHVVWHVDNSLIIGNPAGGMAFPNSSNAEGGHFNNGVATLDGNDLVPNLPGGSFVLRHNETANFAATAGNWYTIAQGDGGQSTEGEGAAIVRLISRGGTTSYAQVTLIWKRDNTAGPTVAVVGNVAGSCVAQIACDPGMAFSKLRIAHNASTGDKYLQVYCATSSSENLATVEPLGNTYSRAVLNPTSAISGLTESAEIDIIPGETLFNGLPTFIVPYADQAEAEAGTSNDKVMTPLRTQNFYDARIATSIEAGAASDDTKIMTPVKVGVGITERLASEFEAEEGTNNTQLMTPLRVTQHLGTWRLNYLASQAEAEAGTNNVNFMSPLRVAQNIDARLATQSQAEFGSNNSALMTPLRVSQFAQASFASQAQAEAGTLNNRLMTPLRSSEHLAARRMDYLASQAEAEAGTNNVNFMTPLRTKQAIDEFATGGGGPEIITDTLTGFPVTTTSTGYTTVLSVTLTQGHWIVEGWILYQRVSGTANYRHRFNVGAGGAVGSISNGTSGTNTGAVASSLTSAITQSTTTAGLDRYVHVVAIVESNNIFTELTLNFQHSCSASSSEVRTSSGSCLKATKVG